MVASAEAEGFEEDVILRMQDRAFSAARINFKSDAGWAVIGLPSGAVALNDENRLLLRLTRAEAEFLAAKLSRPGRMLS